MPDRIRVACVQMTSRTDKGANLETAERLVAQAAATGSDVAVLPEKWNGIGDAAGTRLDPAPRKVQPTLARGVQPLVRRAARRRRVGRCDVGVGPDTRH